MKLAEKLAAGAGYIARGWVNPGLRSSLFGLGGAAAVCYGVAGWSTEAAWVVGGLESLYLSWAWSRVR